MVRNMIHVGIISKEDYKKRTIAISKGEYVPKPDEPKIWFDSFETMADIFNSKNQELLKIIVKENPESISVLEKLTGRSQSNLSKTLHTMARYGIVELRKQKHALKPIVKATDFHIEFGLTQAFSK